MSEEEANLSKRESVEVESEPYIQFNVIVQDPDQDYITISLTKSEYMGMVDSFLSDPKSQEIIFLHCIREGLALLEAAPSDNEPASE